MINIVSWLNNNSVVLFIRKTEEQVLKNTADSESQKVTSCAFCGKSKNEVCQVIHLETGKTICNECVVIWNKSLSDTNNNQIL